MGKRMDRFWRFARATGADELLKARMKYIWGKSPNAKRKTKVANG